MTISAIHASGRQLVIAVTGGGSEAISRLLTVPGASRTVLEAIVPYSAKALNEYLGSEPEQYCSSRTARAMAMVAFQRARELADSTTPVDRVLGVGCTAALATDRPKAGPHRAFVAIQSADATACMELELKKGARSRLSEETILANMIVSEIAIGCEVDPQPKFQPSEGDRWERHVSRASMGWRSVLLGGNDGVQVIGTPLDTSRQPAIFPGAFNPIHDGHRRMAERAAAILGRPIEWEISLENVDKPPLDYAEIESRLGQFGPNESVWLTRAATFVKKAALFPGATFVVGADTIARIADPKYYGGVPRRVDEAIDQLAAYGARFLVFGRLVKGAFQSASDLTLPNKLTALCTEVPASEFRADVSSTELRRRNSQ